MAAAMIIAITGIGIVYAEDMVLEGKVESAVTKLDKNGNEYTRIIVMEEKSLQGISYQVGTPVMVFGEETQTAKQLNDGDTFKCIAQKRPYQGRDSYTVIKFVQ